MSNVYISEARAQNTNNSWPLISENIKNIENTERNTPYIIHDLIMYLDRAQDRLGWGMEDLENPSRLYIIYYH